MTSRNIALLRCSIAAVVALGSMAVAAQSALDAAPTPAQPVNLSTRMRVQTGDNVGIAGFIITGAQKKKVIVRAIGPSLNVPANWRIRRWSYEIPPALW